MLIAYLQRPVFSTQSEAIRDYSQPVFTRTFPPEAERERERERERIALATTFRKREPVLDPREYQV